ncbi:MAG: hypothetical protein AB7I38_17320 [Dehalococcoidia bacterium]
MLVATTVLVMVVAVRPAAGATAADVRDCVIRNLVKYSDPDRAAVAQYVDIEAACRAALDDRATGGIVISDGGGSAAGDARDGSPAEPTTGGDGSASPASGDTSGPSAGGDAEGPAPAARNGDRAQAEPGTGGTTSAALATSLESSSASPSLAPSAPSAWIVALVVLVVAALAAPRLLGVLRRRR